MNSFRVLKNRNSIAIPTCLSIRRLKTETVRRGARWMRPDGRLVDKKKTPRRAGGKKTTPSCSFHDNISYDLRRVYLKRVSLVSWLHSVKLSDVLDLTCLLVENNIRKNDPYHAIRCEIPPWNDASHRWVCFQLYDLKISFSDFPRVSFERLRQNDCCLLFLTVTGID